jgi:hypothetical protein
MLLFALWAMKGVYLERGGHNDITRLAISGKLKPVITFKIMRPFFRRGHLLLVEGRWRALVKEDHRETCHKND